MTHGKNCRCDECEGRVLTPRRIPWPGTTPDQSRYADKPKSYPPGHYKGWGDDIPDYEEGDK